MNRLLPILLTSVYLLVTAQMLLVQVGHELAHAWEARQQGMELRHHHHHHHEGDAEDHHHGDYVETVLSLETPPTEEVPGPEQTRLQQLDVHEVGESWQAVWPSLALNPHGRSQKPACPPGDSLPENPPPEENIA